MPVSNQVKPQQQAEFGWFEIFVGGAVTDSKGRTENYDEARLDQVVRNFKQDQACLVVGHVEKGDASYGDVCDIKREGLKLYAKAKNVDLDFAQAVANHRYPSRSVRFVENADAELELEHIAFLGGEKPAVKGMARLFNSEPRTGFDFAAPNDEINIALINNASAITRMLSKLKTYLIGKEGAETAEQILPQWELEQAAESKTIAQHENYKSRQRSFSAPQTPQTPQKKEDDEVSAEELKAAQAALKAAEEKNRQLEFNQRVNEAKTFINTQVNPPGQAPRLTNVEGMADFMAGLNDDDKTFDFAASDGTSKVSQAQWFKNLMLALPQQDKLTKDFSQSDGDNSTQGDSEKVAQQARDFVNAEKAAGRSVSFAAAVTYVTKNAGN